VLHILLLPLVVLLLLLLLVMLSCWDGSAVLGILQLASPQLVVKCKLHLLLLLQP
jgi:hypothetical protein